MLDSTTRIEIIHSLNKLGVEAHLKGYDALKVAIEEVIEHPEYIHAITKQLYPTIAIRLGSTPMRVERCIRHAIEVLFTRSDHVDDDLWSHTPCDKCKMTNSRFIATIAERIRIKTGVYGEVG